MIRPDERLARLLARDPSLADVLAEAAPGLEKLGHAGIGRIMGRVLTVERAARMAGLQTEELVRRLERAEEPARGQAAAAVPTRDAGEDERAGTPAQAEGASMAGRAGGTTSLPEALAAIPPELIVDLDVRETLRGGGEPFAAIMAARRALPPGAVLRLRAIFEPVPLYFVLGAQGLEHWTERLADDDWRVWFYPGDPAHEEPEAGANAMAGEPAPVAADAGPAGAQPAAEDGGVVVLDVRGLEPPEPMVRTLAALEELPAGATLVQLNVRVPRFLLPHLVERGYSYEVREQDDTLVRTFIRRR